MEWKLLSKQLSGKLFARWYAGLYKVPPPSREPAIADLDAAMDCLEEFLDVMQLLLCKRCTKTKLPGDFCDFPSADRPARPGEIWPDFPLGHHKGAFYQVCRSEIALSEQDIQQWLVSHEHGLFHGLMTAFCAFVATPQIRYSAEIDSYGEMTYAESLLLSSLLHDFARTLGHDEDHDARLKDYFPKLLPETYEHIRPREITPLICADRIELQRYPNHVEWCDGKTLQSCVDESTWRILRSFYNHIRPALLRLYQNQDKIWIRHGIENFDQYVGDPQWPPLNSYQNINDAGWSVEIGRLPYGFHNCINHAPIWCPWKALAGIIPYDPGLKLTASGWRDHFQVESQGRPIQEWLFLYGRTRLFDRGMTRVCADLLEKGAFFLRWRGAYNFMKIAQQIQDRIIVSNWRNN